MKTVDVSQMIVIYNFVIGLLVMLSSEKLGAYAGHINAAHGVKIARLTKVSTFTFGACVAFLAGTLYIVVNLIGLLR